MSCWLNFWEVEITVFAGFLAFGKDTHNYGRYTDTYLEIIFQNLMESSQKLLERRINLLSFLNLSNKKID